MQLINNQHIVSNALNFCKCKCLIVSILPPPQRGLMR